MVRAGTDPSAPVSSSLTNRPARVAPEMWPSKVAPMRSARKWASKRSKVSRSAFMARRSAAAMNDEVGITADRRGEMGVAAQVETEMPVVLGGIFCLRLRAQHHLVDELFD